jgi:hypothetical protein
VYGTVVKDPSVGGVSLNFLRVMNSIYLIELDEIWLESFNFGLSRQANHFPILHFFFLLFNPSIKWTFCC